MYRLDSAQTYGRKLCSHFDGKSKTSEDPRAANSLADLPCQPETCMCHTYIYIYIYIYIYSKYKVNAYQCCIRAGSKGARFHHLPGVVMGVVIVPGATSATLI